MATTLAHKRGATKVSSRSRRACRYGCSMGTYGCSVGTYGCSVGYLGLQRGMLRVAGEQQQVAARQERVDERVDGGDVVHETPHGPEQLQAGSR